MKARRGQLVRCYGSVENTEIIGGAVESVNVFTRSVRLYVSNMDGLVVWSGAEAVVFCRCCWRTHLLQKNEIIRCSSIECKWVHFDSYEPIKVFTRSVRLYVSNMDGLVVWSDRSVFRSAKMTTIPTKMTTIPAKILPPSSNDRFRPKSNRL